MAEDRIKALKRGISKQLKEKEKEWMSLNKGPRTEEAGNRMKELEKEIAELEQKTPDQLLEDIKKEYMKLQEKYDKSLNSEEKSRIKKRMDELDKEISELEKPIGKPSELSPEPPQPPKPTPEPKPEEPIPKPETPEAKIIAADAEKNIDKIVKGIKKSEDAKKVLEDDKLFFELTGEGKKLKSILEVIEWLKQLGKSGTKEQRLAKFLEHFHPEKEEAGKDLIHWIEYSINDKDLASQLKAIKKEVMKIEEFEKQWKATGGSIEDFLRNDRIQEVAEMVKLKVIKALQNRIKKSRKKRKKAEDEVQEKIDKKKKVIEDLAIKGEELIQKQKEIYKIEDEVTKRIDHCDDLVSWILEYKTKLLTLTRRERIEGWKKISEAVGTLVDHSTKISELAAKGQEEIKVVEKDSDKAAEELGEATKFS
ncbi:hypothetical protein MBGDC06_00103 [Thermoplasmatales archaeon SCGC AB-539-C06]|nr:hypothetical protein MBGDC06_00103 [Thermoplasmatales archaeon SCGC AB-539-C06]